MFFFFWEIVDSPHLLCIILLALNLIVQLSVDYPFDPELMGRIFPRFHPMYPRQNHMNATLHKFLKYHIPLFLLFDNKV